MNDLRGVLSVVTGGGKTVFAQLCILEFLKLYPGGRIVIIVPTTSLLDQWHVSLQEDLGVSANEIASYSGDEKAKKPRIINLMVINTARSLAAQLSEEQDSFLIVDECHRAGSPVNALSLKGTHQASLGLSATPQREYDDGFEEYIVPALGSVIYEYGYENAFSDGVISPFELVNVRTNLLPHEQSRFDKLSKRIAVEFQRSKNEVLNEERLKRLLQQRARVSAAAAMRVPVAAKLVELNRGVRTLVFHESIESANALVHILNERSHSATIYHSKIGPTVRRDNLRLYRKGAFDILVTCRALDEGLNVPETRVAIIASSTASTRQRIQRLGRVLRPAPGKTHAIVYTIYATDQEEKRLIKEASGFNEITAITWQRGLRRQDG